MNIFKIVAAALILAASPAALAGPYADALGVCLADNTTGKERKDLARWIFVAIAAHPDIKALSKVRDADREQANRDAGQLVTRLISENCAAQTRQAIAQEGTQSLQTAFGVLGQIAMQELLTDESVRASLLGYEKYIDKTRMDAFFDDSK